MRFLVIGLGSMGKRRIRNLHALGEKEIIGFEPKQERRAEVEKEYGIATVADLNDLPASAYDVIIISAPPDLHAQYLRKALTERKHAFTETGVTRDIVDEILAKGDDGLVRAPSCTFRFFEPMQRMKGMLTEGRIGTPLAYTYHLGQYLPDWHPWEDYRDVFFAKKETGACRELFPFELCWLTWLFESPVQDATGRIAHISALDMPADDVLMAALTHQNNIRGNMTIEVISRNPMRLFRIMGSEGTITWDWLAKTLTVYDARTKETETHTVGEGTNKHALAIEEMYIEEMRAFLNAVNNKAPFPYTWQEVRANVGVLEALEATQNEG